MVSQEFVLCVSAACATVLCISWAVIASLLLDIDGLNIEVHEEMGILKVSVRLLKLLQVKGQDFAANNL